LRQASAFLPQAGLPRNHLVPAMTGCRALQERRPGLSNAAMGDDAAKGTGAQRNKRQQRLAEALRQNLKRRKAQARSRAGEKPGGESGATPDKNPAGNGN